jgi:rhodanese-related sulfurtransferase
MNTTQSTSQSSEQLMTQDRKSPLEGSPESSQNMIHTVFKNVEENLHYPGVLDVDPRELESKLADKSDQMVLIDVRQPEEFTGELGHIPNAKLLVLDTLEENLNEVPKDKTVVFVCRSGSRSARASALAMEHGYNNVVNLKGGMILWNELHFETEA